MRLTDLVAGMPEYASDLKANFDRLILRVPGEDAVLRWGTLVAAAMVAGSAVVTRAVMGDAAGMLSPAELDGARLAAATMTLNNHFYKHRSMTLEPAHKEFRAGLRTAHMRRAAAKGGSHFKLWCLTVSVLHGCAVCVQSNERDALQAGATADQIASVLRLAALVKALAVVAEAERAVSAAGADSGPIA